MIATLAQAIKGILAVIRIVAIILLTCSVGINFVNIVGRYFFRAPIFWADEAMLFLMVGCVFLGIGQVAWTGQHIRMDVFLRMMPGPVRDALYLLSDIAMAATGIVLAVFAWPTLRQLEAFDQRSLAADIPLVIPQGMIPFGLSLMALLLACRIVTGRWRPSAPTSDH
jgi:TRAP-type C4-dicarboxylate transport system permease small subunit